MNARRLPVVVLAVLAMAATGCLGDDPPAVETGEVVTAEVTETISAPAQVSAAERRTVTAQISGLVTDLAVTGGDMVEEGEVLARLESPQLDQAVAQAEEALTALESTPDVQAATDLSGIDPLPTPTNPLADAVAELDAAVLPQLEAARHALEQAVAPEQVELPDEIVDALPDEIADSVDTTLTLPAPAGGEQAEAALDALDATYRGVREALVAAGAAAAAQQRAVSDQLAASLTEVEDALDGAITSVGAQITAAQRAQADAALAQAEAQRENLVVRAPISGVVQLGRGGGLPDLGSLGGLGGFGFELPDDVTGGAEESSGAETEIAQGTAVVPGQELFTIIDQSTWYVDAFVDEVDAPAVAEGLRATVLIDAFPGQSFAGVVESVALTAERGLTGGVSFLTRVRLLDAPSEPSPRVGMTASVEIATATVEADLAVPARAVVRRDVGTAVYVVRERVAVLVPVELVAQGDEVAAVDGDLEVGEQVIVAGYEELPDGTEVRVE